MPKFGLAELLRNLWGEEKTTDPFKRGARHTEGRALAQLQFAVGMEGAVIFHDAARFRKRFNL